MAKGVRALGNNHHATLMRSRKQALVWEPLAVQRQIWALCHICGRGLCNRHPRQKKKILSVQVLSANGVDTPPVESTAWRKFLVRPTFVLAGGRAHAHPTQTRGSDFDRWALIAWLEVTKQQLNLVLTLEDISGQGLNTRWNKSFNHKLFEGVISRCLGREVQ